MHFCAVHALIGWGQLFVEQVDFENNSLGLKSYGLKGKYESLFGIFFSFSPEVQLHIPEEKADKI